MALAESRHSGVGSVFLRWSWKSFCLYWLVVLTAEWLVPGNRRPPRGRKRSDGRKWSSLRWRPLSLPSALLLCYCLSDLYDWGWCRDLVWHLAADCLAGNNRVLNSGSVCNLRSSPAVVLPSSVRPPWRWHLKHWHYCCWHRSWPWNWCTRRTQCRLCRGSGKQRHSYEARSTPKTLP